VKFTGGEQRELCLTQGDSFGVTILYQFLMFSMFWLLDCRSLSWRMVDHGQVLVLQLNPQRFLLLVGV